VKGFSPVARIEVVVNYHRIVLGANFFLLLIIHLQLLNAQLSNTIKTSKVLLKYHFFLIQPWNFA